MGGLVRSSSPLNLDLNLLNPDGRYASLSNTSSNEEIFALLSTPATTVTDGEDDEVHVADVSQDFADLNFERSRPDKSDVHITSKLDRVSRTSHKAIVEELHSFKQEFLAHKAESDLRHDKSEEDRAEKAVELNKVTRELEQLKADAAERKAIYLYCEYSKRAMEALLLTFYNSATDLFTPEELLWVKRTYKTINDSTAARSSERTPSSLYRKRFPSFNVGDLPPAYDINIHGVRDLDREHLNNKVRYLFANDPFGTWTIKVTEELQRQRFQNLQLRLPDVHEVPTSSEFLDFTRKSSREIFEACGNRVTEEQVDERILAASQSMVSVGNHGSVVGPASKMQ